MVYTEMCDSMKSEPTEKTTNPRVVLQSANMAVCTSLGSSRKVIMYKIVES